MEYDHDLSDDERLVFAPDERPPPYDPAAQPAPPATEWSQERLAKASRNYAVEYIRNGFRALADVIGRDRALEHGKRAARLIGLQNFPIMAAAVMRKMRTGQKRCSFSIQHDGGHERQLRCGEHCS